MRNKYPTKLISNSVTMGHLTRNPAKPTHLSTLLIVRLQATFGECIFYFNKLFCIRNNEPTTSHTTLDHHSQRKLKPPGETMCQRLLPIVGCMQMCFLATIRNTTHTTHSPACSLCWFNSAGDVRLIPVYCYNNDNVFKTACIVSVLVLASFNCTGFAFPAPFQLRRRHRRDFPAH